MPKTSATTNKEPLYPHYLPSKHKRMVEHWDDERKAGNSLIVTLKDGFYWGLGDEGEHVRGFDTIREAMDEFVTVKRCYCKSCKKAAQPLRAFAETL